jgi:beta-barrel assembly-enhancing protease
MRWPKLVRAAIAGLLAVSMTASGVLAQGVPPSMALDSDEAGLWLMFEKAEKDIQRSPLLIKDPALNAYVRGIVCKIAGPRCSEIRIYILDIPMFNASMAPNGMMHVWSGLLLRVKNEAELAFVLGHEYRHFTAKHSLNQYQSMRDTANVLSFFGLIAAGVGVGFVGSLAQLAALGAMFSYGRDQEREADTGGLEALTANGYDPRAGGAIWSSILEEHAANQDRESRSLFTATHPKPEERAKALVESAEKMLASGTPAGVTGEAPLRAALKPHRMAWLDNELARGEYDESLVLINRLLQVEPSSGELLFFQGEAYRRRDKDGDLQAARDSYQRAISQAVPFASAFRGLGLVAMKQGDKPAARQAFTQYLAKAPQADDRAMIDFYLKSL